MGALQLLQAVVYQGAKRLWLLLPATTSSEACKGGAPWVRARPPLLLLVLLLVQQRCLFRCSCGREAIR